MRKIIIFAVFFIGLIFVWGEPSMAALYGTIRVNYKISDTVAANQSFTLTVEGFTDSGKVMDKVGFSSPSSYSGYSSVNNWYMRNCGRSNTTCNQVWTISESVPGKYFYTGKVVDASFTPDGMVLSEEYADTVQVTVVAPSSPSPGPSSAAKEICPIGAVCLENPLGVSTFDALLNKIIDFIFWAGITIAPLVFIAAGFLYVTAVGDAKKIETAKHMMLYAVIGLTVLLLAKGLVAVIKSVIGVQ